jgi:antagonist of KipI
MGYRMEGAKLSLKEKIELISTAVTRGIVQVTNEGHPIILMADAQTIGGYPRIARIASYDLSKLAQCRPGVKVEFCF